MIVDCFDLRYSYNWGKGCLSYCNEVSLVNDEWISVNWKESTEESGDQRIFLGYDLEKAGNRAPGRDCDQGYIKENALTSDRRVIVP